MGLRCALHEQDASDCERWAFPCVAMMKSAADPAAPLRPALLVAADANRVLSFAAGQSTPATLTREDFSAQYGGVGLFATRAAEKAEADEPGSDPGAQRFGFRWFVPELLKHNARSGATCCSPRSSIQLMALATPLFTQVDHRQGGGAPDDEHARRDRRRARRCSCCSPPRMTWVRQYLVLHTGNRVDAVLGSAGVRAPAAAAAALLRAPADRRAGRARCTAWRRSASSSPARRSRCCSTCRSC